MFLANFKAKFQGAVKKFSGRTDFLEAVCASCALVTAADGEIKEAEIKASIKAVSANPTLSQAFKQAQIEKTMDAMLKRAESGRTGRIGLYKEIDQVSKDPEMSEIVYLAALDIADSDGSVGPEEKKVLGEIAKRLSLNPSTYANV